MEWTSPLSPGNIKKAVRSTDWRILLFLLLFLNVKLVVKVAALLIIYLLRPGFKFGFSLKNSRLPLFYLAAIAIAVFNWLISGMIFNVNYDLLMGTGVFFWILCILAVQQIKSAVEINDPAVMHRTILVFFIINALVSLMVYVGIIWETGSINPYRYQGQFQKYFIGTGDYIKGISMDTSTTNAVLNAFGVIYFLLRGKYAFALLCMCILLLTGSNVTNLLLCGTLVLLFLFKSSRDQKSVIVICLLLLLVFLVKISPQNNEYITAAFNRLTGRQADAVTTAKKYIRITDRPDSTLSAEEKKQKTAQLYLDSISRLDQEQAKQPVQAGLPDASLAVTMKVKPEIPKPNIHTAPYQHKHDTTAFQEQLIKFAALEKIETVKVADSVTTKRLPGKLIAVKQTINYFKNHPLQLLTGTGMGNFSSKLAFRATALGIAGGYPEKYQYVNDAFKNNHLDLYLFYFTRQAGLHSLVNTPNSTYLQLISEYGIAGLAAFVFLYLAFFVKQIKTSGYGMPLMLLMAGAFFADYWFELLSVVPVFELLLFLNIKETQTTLSK
jgi:hypothetical protein